MDEKEANDSDWNPDDAIAKELEITDSQKNESFNQPDDHVDGDVDYEVLIKPDDESVDNLPANRKWSPRENAFFFSRLVSFL